MSVLLLDKTSTATFYAETSIATSFDPAKNGGKKFNFEKQ